MTPDERDRLATLIANELLRVATHAERTHAERTHAERTHADLRPADRASADHAPAGRSLLAGLPWLAIPPRPAPPERSSDPPPWTGAAQSLGDVAPIRRPTPSAYRADAALGAADVRAAAAGKGTSRQFLATGVSLDPARAHGARASQRESPGYPAATRRRALGTAQVPVGISRRHLHLSPEHLRVLFGTEQLDVHRTIRQPGQFAAEQVVDAVGPKGRLERLRVVGPARDETQLEIARSDAQTLGIDAPVAASGALDLSVGGVTLVGPAGRLELRRGVIVAARHLHLAPDDARRWGVLDGDRVDIRCGEGARALTWHNVLVRAGQANATEFHLDEDEARAAALGPGDIARIVAWHERRPTRRVLITEEQLRQLVEAGTPLPPNAIYTPGARDRARSLGVVLP